MSFWQRADPVARGIVHPARDEALDPATDVDDAEGGVLRANERANLVDDDLQHVIDGGESGDASDRSIKRGLDLMPRSLL